MLITLLIPLGDLTPLLLVSFDFSFFVLIRLDLQHILHVSLMLICLVYFEVFQTLLPEYCVFFVGVFIQFIMEHFPITLITLEFIKLS